MTKRFMLGVDGIVVSSLISSFLDGLVMLFASFYIFSIEYPAKCAITLEFFQRYVLVLYFYERVDLMLTKPPSKLLRKNESCVWLDLFNTGEFCTKSAKVGHGLTDLDQTWSG